MQAGKWVFDWTPLIRAVYHGSRESVAVADLALTFHVALADGLVSWVKAASNGIRRVALSGGVFCNALLLERVQAGLRAAGYEVLSQSRVPSNDGGLAVGQAAIAAALSLEARPCA